ncbi:MAG: hypothetical protein EXS10_09010 [Phycisphaerales bacterium]|nr:hypothetical protein [Phycisphaerales bacterium]
MKFGYFRTAAAPILADFGGSGLKLLQVSHGNTPAITAAAFIPVPDSLRCSNAEERFAHLAVELPKALKRGGFSGSRVVVSPWSAHMLVQHYQVAPSDGATLQANVLAQVSMQLQCDPFGLVVRTVDVCETARDGQPRGEVIAMAMSRLDVMSYINLFKGVKLSVIGIHGEIAAMMHAFDHIHRRIEDSAVTTMYVDIGWSGTKVAIAHGADLAFAKWIALGGRHFDQSLADVWGVTPMVANARRITDGFIPQRHVVAARASSANGEEFGGGMAMLRSAMAAQSSQEDAARAHGASAVATDRREGNVAPALGSDVTQTNSATAINALREQIDSLADDLSMCMRYHTALFPSRPLDRVVFLGGEARGVGLCQQLAAALRLPAKAGDPLARVLAHGSAPAGLPDSSSSHPGWAVVCGLASAPNDL